MVRPARGESGDSPVEPKSYERLSTQLSALLCEMVRTQDVEVAESWSPEVQPGGTIGRFKLVRELGRGGFGVVYEAADSELNRTVALKVVKPGTRIAARGSQWLMREAEAVARLNHPNIVTLHDFGQGPTGPYLVFELLRGQTLSARLQHGPLPLDEVIDVGISIARALVHAHGAGVVHRDLTAANVHLAEDGAQKVLDFGLAHLFGRDGANDGGTPAYMAPEQWEGDQGDGRTDLFAMGVILFQALTGKFPYEVDKGWSEALEPGETPRLPRSAGPLALRRLVRSMLERDPGQRPQSARAVRDVLLKLRRDRDGLARGRVLWGTAAVALAAVATAGWLYLNREAPRGEQVGVVIADLEGGGDGSALEAVPGLLATALEPSPRVRVVPHSRLAYVSRAAGLGTPGKLGAENGKELARLAGAAVLLLPSTWQEDGKPVVAVRAVEAESGRSLFTAKATVGLPGQLAAAVDRITEEVRRELKERSDDRRLQRPVAEVVTSNPEAARYYYRGVDCVERPPNVLASSEQCATWFESALALDPTFPLAHYQLAALTMIPGDSGEQSQPHLRVARDAAGRLPAREAQLVRALSSWVDGRDEEARRIYEGLLASTPDDPGLLSALGDLEGRRGDWPAAARYLEKLVAVEPDRDLPLQGLVEALGRSSQVNQLADLAGRLEAQGLVRAVPLVQAYVWLGEHDAALRVARRAVETGGDSRLSLLRYATQAAGEFAEAEVIARRESELGSPDAGPVDTMLAAQGRVREAFAWYETHVARYQSGGGRRGVYWRQAILSAITGDVGRVKHYATQASAVAPRYSADLAVLLAVLGDGPGAEELAAAIPPGTALRDQYEAVKAWRGGRATQALASLARAEASDPWPNEGFAPAFLLAEVNASVGDDQGTIAAVERFRRLPPDRAWRAWGYPRSLLLSARAHARLGDRRTARAEVGRLLSLMAKADPGLPIVRDARALKARL